jgi:hypothetical protein
MNGLVQLNDAGFVTINTRLTSNLLRPFYKGDVYRGGGYGVSGATGSGEEQQEYQCRKQKSVFLHTEVLLWVSESLEITWL